ncbi:MAG: polysaccharide pyruvyl transferase family protein [Bacteroidales bacterium]|nr:polysaccharide pyruvyl transferase family protein [Bacteroidales bacterium]
MKIGILTLPLHTNYGGILQAWALQTVLERMGHEVKVLNRNKKMSINWFIYPLKIIKRIVWRYIFNEKKNAIIYEIKKNEERSIKEKYTSKFVKKYINSLYYKTVIDLENLNFEAIVVGSDQVWSHEHARNICGSVINAFLPFTKGKQMKRISYAASFGKDYWEYTVEETTRCKEYIKSFDSVSVREESAISLCKQYFGVDAICHLDPTLLLNAEDYMKLLSIHEVPKSKGNLLLYIIDKTENKMHIVDSISSNLHLKPFEVNSRAEDTSGTIYPLEQRIQPPVEQWLRGFYDADYVVTDSFHACVFSILFQKPFVVIGNKQRGMARFESLLKKLNLESRLIDGYAQLTPSLIQSPIEWKEVSDRLDLLRMESMNYLKQNL